MNDSFHEHFNNGNTNPKFTIEDLRSEVPWGPVCSELLELMPKTKFDKNNPEEALIRFSDITRFIEKVCAELARKMRLPYRDVYRLVRQENKAFLKMRFALFFTRYAPFATFALDDPAMKELMALLVLPNTDIVINRASDLRTACKRLRPEEMALFLAEVMKKDMSDEEYVDFVHDLIQGKSPEARADIMYTASVSIHPDERIAFIESVFKSLPADKLIAFITGYISAMSDEDKRAFLTKAGLVPKQALDNLRTQHHLHQSSEDDENLVPSFLRGDE